MAEESAEEDVDGAERKVEMSENNDSIGRKNWVSFEDECEVPLLPRPPCHENNMSSEKYIDRLEQKLHHIKNPNITGKIIVSALTEARESQMNNLMSETAASNSNASFHQTPDDFNWDDEITEPRCCCVVMYYHLFPKQAKTTQEVECLLDEDELAIVNSELADRDLATQPTVMT